MDVRLTKLHEEGRDFLIRVCMGVSDTDHSVVGSVIKQCEECDRDVWYATNQQIPVVPGLNVEAEVVLCLPCTSLHQSLTKEPPKWIGPRPI